MKKIYIKKNYDAILLLKYDSAEKRYQIMLTVYVLKNGLGRYNIFFFFTQSLLNPSSFLCCFRVESVNVTIRFEHVFFINKQFRTCANAFPDEFTVRSYGYCACQHWNFTGHKKIKQRRISFVLGYLLMILWKFSTAISIKYRIFATFNKKKNSILTAFKDTLFNLHNMLFIISCLSPG